MFDNYTAILGACLGLSAGLVYAIAAWRGSVSPNRVTWSLWAAIPLIIFSASVSKSAGLQSLFSLSAGLGPAVVVSVLLVKREGSYRKFNRLDLGCCFLSLLAIGLWIVTRDGNFAIGLSLVADLAAAMPTLFKAYSEPHSESVLAYLLYLIGATLELLSTQRWTAANVAFSLYAAALYFVLCSVLVMRRARGAVRLDPRSTRSTSS